MRSQDGNRIARRGVSGIRWGIGHSAGVALVGLACLILREALPVSTVSAWSERSIGVLLIAMAGFSSIVGWVAARYAVRGTAANRSMIYASALAAMGVGMFWLVQ